MKIGRSSKGLQDNGCRWVFCKKDNEQYKARLITNGYAQKEDINYLRSSLL